MRLLRICVYHHAAQLFLRCTVCPSPHPSPLLELMCLSLDAQPSAPRSVRRQPEPTGSPPRCLDFSSAAMADDDDPKYMMGTPNRESPNSSPLRASAPTPSRLLADSLQRTHMLSSPLLFDDPGSPSTTRSLSSSAAPSGAQGFTSPLRPFQPLPSTRARGQSVELKEHTWLPLGSSAPASQGPSLRSPSGHRPTRSWHLPALPVTGDSSAASNAEPCSGGITRHLRTALLRQRLETSAPADDPMSMSTPLLNVRALTNSAASATNIVGSGLGLSSPPWQPVSVSHRVIPSGAVCIPHIQNTLEDSPERGRSTSLSANRSRVRLRSESPDDPAALRQSSRSVSPRTRGVAASPGRNLLDNEPDPSAFSLDSEFAAHQEASIFEAYAVSSTAPR